MSEDWVETTNRLINREDICKQFEDTAEYWEAFQVWASKEYVEEYGND